MEVDYIFTFKKNIEEINTEEILNNPFNANPPEIAQIAAHQFQEHIQKEHITWEHNFDVDKGKMFGVLVVKLENGTIAFLGTISGKLKGEKSSDKFIPSVFDDSTDDFFINKGMKELSSMGDQITKCESEREKSELIEIRKQKSFELQQRLFENYRFLNLTGETKNVLQIFKDSYHGNPPAAAGECAAPKLLNYALRNKHKPIALAEFWWGKSPKSEERKHLGYYPACKNKCRPILEYMLDDNTLYNSIE